MYIPGKLKHNNKVMVDIGTGYYVEKVWLIGFTMLSVTAYWHFLVSERGKGIFSTPDGPYY